jgi:hypothetical protein
MDRVGPEAALSTNGKSGSPSAGNGSAKDEEDFNPVVLNDVAGWLRALRLPKYTPNFEDGGY